MPGMTRLTARPVKIFGENLIFNFLFGKCFIEIKETVSFFIVLAIGKFHCHIRMTVQNAGYHVRD